MNRLQMQPNEDVQDMVKRFKIIVTNLKFSRKDSEKSRESLQDPKKPARQGPRVTTNEIMEIISLSIVLKLIKTLTKRNQIKSAGKKEKTTKRTWFNEDSSSDLDFD